MSDHSLSGTWVEIWDILAEGVARRDAGARFVALATTTPDGPEIRTLALRSADRETAALSLHTDMRSTKVKEIAAMPAIALLVWDPTRQVQLRLNGTARISPGDSALWQRVPAASREAYGHVPAPGTPITRSDAWHVAPDPAHFAIITLDVTRIDHVSLDPAGHRRALFFAENAWAGQWISP